MPDHDVLIVGAGPVGMLLACLLRQDGVNVAILERRVDADARTRAIGIHRPGLDALDAAGLGQAVRAEALVLDGGDVVSRGRTLASLTFSEDRPVLVLPQHRTDALLRRRLEELPGGGILEGRTVTGLRDAGDEVTVVADGPEAPTRQTAGMVVVADGVHSPLRASLGIRWRRRPGSGAYAMADIDDAEAGRRATLFCEPGGLVESFPLPGGRRRWVVRTDAPGMDGTVTADRFRHAIETRTGVRPRLAPGEDPTSFTVAQHAARSFVRGRIVLLGDAAHETSPIGGQGMNLGWLDAVRLAAEILSTRPGRMPELAGWDRRARRSAGAAQRRSLFYMAMGAPVPPAAARARESLIRTLGARPLRRATAGLITMRGL
ncbi:FAD-dependent oxidoreductase [Microbacterium sp. 179-I 3D4 NHS]|uniref:FAD-dependent oxidoreductase n=1 Tax=Microbacterium sp. 179-I 3D4 NHS TaxID=3142381 RepID=UPI0039A01337